MDRKIHQTEQCVHRRLYHQRHRDPLPGKAGDDVPPPVPEVLVLVHRAGRADLGPGHLDDPWEGEGGGGGKINAGKSVERRGAFQMRETSPGKNSQRTTKRSIE